MRILKLLLENAKYIMVLLVLGLMVSTVGAFIWALFETGTTIITLFTNYKGTSSTIAAFVQLLDIYLIVAVLYIFAMAMYELFVGEIKLPSWLVIHNFDELKALLSNVVILILGVSFLKYFLERNDPISTLLYAVSAAVISLALIQYRHHGGGNGSH